jgi:nitrate reductase gamma subunit
VIDFYDLALGPLFILAWGLFAAGFAWRIILFRAMTRPAHAAPVPRPARGAPAGEDFAFLTRGMSRSAKIAFRFTRWVRRTVFPVHPVMGVMSLVFHIGLFLVPLLLPAHTLIFSRSAHVSLPSLPGPFMDKLTLVLLAIGGFFLLRRLFFPRVRALSTLRDYLVLLLVAAPLLTAYAAYHQWLNYRTMLVIHMLVGDTVIAAIPFTKLGHMPFLIYTRFFVSSEYSLRPGGRRW